jgi:hypothetical protein
VKASERRYRDDLSRDHPDCVCGALAESHHHIIHLNGQRITKDEMLVVPLCRNCHQGKGGVHDCGGERQFLATTGHDLVHLAVLRRHNWEVANA